MSKDDERARREFTGEADELLEGLSSDLATLEAEGRNVRPEVINKIFREVHSLKGLAGMLGFTGISDLAHALEDLLDRLRMGKVEITRDLIDLLYDSVDALNRLVLSLTDPSIGVLVDMEALGGRIRSIAAVAPQRSAEDPLSSLLLDEPTKRSLTEYEEHRLLENLRAGKEILSLEVVFDFADFDERLRALTASLSESGEVISTLPGVDTSGRNGIAFRLLYGSSLDAEAVSARAVEARVTSLRRTVTKAPPPAAAEPSAAADDDPTLRALTQTVRVDIEKLDRVMNIVGELILERTQLDAIIRTHDVRLSRSISHELTKVSRNLDRKLNELQKSVIETRMVPIGQIYTRLSRAVRKLARELGKEIDLVLRGEQTELDKRMVEDLTDPLMHIIRNALDHGIESPQERSAAGKPPHGNIRLTAYPQGHSVVLDVADDGRGVDPELVRQVAIRRGLVGEQEVVDSRRAYELLFTPGFSTAGAVSEISGRGVGLDVVRKNIQELKGTIEISSEPGKGTTFRIVLPITLAIIKVLLVRAGGETFAIPITSVEEALRIETEQLKTVERREVFTLRDQTLAVLRLADAFDLGEQDSNGHRKFIVISRAGEKRVALLVDGLVGQQEIVIKSIGERLKRTPGVAGATEIGESEIVLVVDVGSLVDHVAVRAREGRAGGVIG